MTRKKKAVKQPIHTFYDLYVEMTHTGVRTVAHGLPGGLCMAIGSRFGNRRADNFRKRMEPGRRGEGILKRQGKSYTFWGADADWPRTGILTDLRQNLILLYACSIGERIPSYEPPLLVKNRMNTDQTPAAAPQVGAAAQTPFTVAVGQSVLYIPQPPKGNEVEFFPEIENGMDYNADTREQCRLGIPMAAIVTRVWSQSCVNLTVFPDNGQPYFVNSVLADDGNKNPRRFVV